MNDAAAYLQQAYDFAVHLYGAQSPEAKAAEQAAIEFLQGMNHERVHETQ